MRDVPHERAEEGWDTPMPKKQDAATDTTHPYAPPMDAPTGAEEQRLTETWEQGASWYRWGPYLSERQWGTVREDYSRARRRLGLLPARSRPLAAPTAGARTACWASATTRAPLLRARALERRGPDPQGAPLRPHRPEGNHGEDVKEYYFYPRQHADPLLHEGALQVPAARLPLRRARGGEPPPRHGTSPSTS